MSAKILLVEDEEALVLSLTDRLKSEGYSVSAVGDGELGLERAATGEFDLILLDLMLPKRSGIDVCRDLRQLGIETPILMLTARGQMVDKVLGLKLGADDYVTKPFEMLEVLARVEALLRRRPKRTKTDQGSYEYGSIRVDFRSADVERGGERVDLSALEYKLLRYFIAHSGEMLPRDRLLDEVWGYDATPYTRTVDQHVASLRRKLEENPSKPQFILTVHGMGYKFTG